MKLMKKMLVLLLALSLLAGCTGTPATSPEDTDPGDSLVTQTTGLAPGTIGFQLNGVDYPMETYLYWVAYITDMYAYYGYNIDWEEMQDGMTAAEFFKNDALDTAVLYLTCEQQGKALGLSLSDAEKAEIRTGLEEIKVSWGDEYFAFWLDTMYLTEEGLVALEEQMSYRDLLYDYYYGENGTQVPTAAEINAYAEEMGYLCAKHILISTVMEDGTVYSEEEKQAALTLANDLRDQLRAGGDTPELFDQLMQENSEDPGSFSYPQGYLFNTGEMVAAFENGTRALAVDEISEPVESDYGYHIILRQELDAQIEEGFTDTILGELFSGMTDQWLAEADLTTSEAWAGFDIADFDTKRDAYITEYEAAMAAAEAAAAAETATPPETESAAPADNGENGGEVQPPDEG